MYSESPRVTDVSAYTIGATVPGTHAIMVEEEYLGQSSGEAGQSFNLEHAPVLSLAEGETVEVEEKRSGELAYVPWQQVGDFSRSERFDRHFVLDSVHGQVQFGPAVRQQDGTVRQYGRVPEPGRGIRFSRYRRGGGVIGNLPADSLQVLTTSLAYISRVTNPRRAAGGRDGETLDEVRTRAQREMRAQQRAVTFEDYEQLALTSTRSVARVRCNVPSARSTRLPPGTVEILVVPAVADSLWAGDLSKLQVDDTLAQVVADYLDSYRLLTTVLSVQEPRYMGVRVKAEIVPDDYVRPEQVKTRVIEALNGFLSPLPLADRPEEHDELMGSSWSGWPFGRDLYVAEVLSMIQRVPGVKHVLDVRVGWRTVLPQKELPLDAEEDEGREAPALRSIDGRVLRVPADTLLCSIGHEIVIAELEE
jgi:predicted phage baseplate assembly protein